MRNFSFKQRINREKKSQNGEKYFPVCLVNKRITGNSNDVITGEECCLSCGTRGETVGIREKPQYEMDIDAIGNLSARDLDWKILRGFVERGLLL